MAMPERLPPPSTRSVKIAQPFFTRKGVRRDGSIHTSSRIDDIFVRPPMADLRDFQCHSHIVGTIGDKSISSDHIPVQLVIECPRKQQLDHPVIRRWLTQHPLFTIALEVEHRNMLYDVDPFSSRSISSMRLLFVHVPRPGRPF